MPPTNEGPSESVLAALPPKALQFLSTLSRSVPIRAALAARGYDDSEHERGWALLLEVTGYRAPLANSQTLATDVRDAVVEIDAWDEPNFRIIRAALESRHPEQAVFVMGDLSASTGYASVPGLAKLLDRLDELESGKDRKATRKEDHAALATLEKRGITKAERARLHGLVETAKKADMPEAVEHLEKAAEGSAQKSKQAQAEALRKLYAWYREWSETARSVIARRDYLIRLGLAKRKAGKGNEPAPA
jgi:hypothetical protein